MSRLEEIKKKRHADEWHGVLNDIDWLIEKLEKCEDALIWCGGSPDFNPGGQAREGWMKIVVPLLKSIREGK